MACSSSEGEETKTFQFGNETSLVHMTEDDRSIDNLMNDMDKRQVWIRVSPGNSRLMSKLEVSTLIVYFESTSRSGGGEIENYKIDNGYLFMKYKNPDVIERVLKISHAPFCETLNLERIQGNDDLETPPTDTSCMLVQNIPTNMTKDKILDLLKTCSDMEATPQLFTGSNGVLVKYPDEIKDFDSFKCKLVMGSLLVVSKVPFTTFILVKNVTRRLNESLISIFFERPKTGGGDIQKSRIDYENKSALIQFKDYKAAQSVLDKKEYNIHLVNVTVQPYYEILGEQSDCCEQAKDILSANVTSGQVPRTAKSTESDQNSRPIESDQNSQPIESDQNSQPIESNQNSQSIDVSSFCELEERYNTLVTTYKTMASGMLGERKERDAILTDNMYLKKEREDQQRNIIALETKVEEYIKSISEMYQELTEKNRKIESLLALDREDSGQGQPRVPLRTSQTTELASLHNIPDQEFIVGPICQESDHTGSVSSKDINLITCLSCENNCKVMKAEYQGGVIVVNQFGLPERTNAPNYLQRELLRRYDLMKELQSNFMVRCLAKCCEPDQGNFWLLTEFMELQSLQEVLANQDIVLDWDVKTNMAYDVCHGLLNLHCRQEPMVLGKIGTDMFQVDQQKHVKLYDVSGVHTLTDSLESLYKAEDAYIPPEHLREKINGGKDEKYSLETESYGAGVVLFEIATRLPPFQGKTDREIYTFLTDGNLEELPVNCPLTYRVVTDGLRATDRQKRKSLRYAVSELNRQKTSQI